jgi:dTMP kinase
MVIVGDNQGRFIVFEGIDGSGKSTQIRHAEQVLTTSGHDVYATFEPTDGPVGVLIRQMLEGRVDTDQRTIASLFAADRTDHLCNRENGIAKMVEDGRVVLCDRYYFSSYAYHAQYIDMEWVIHANSLNAQILKPDVTIFLDVDPEICFERIKKNRDRFDMYEKMDIMKRVRANYFKAFERLKDHEQVVVVDGNGPVETVEKQVKKTIEQQTGQQP